MSRDHSARREEREDRILERGIERLLEELRKTNLSKVTPTIHGFRGVRYSDLEKIFRSDARLYAHRREILKALEEEGILSKTIESRAVACPHCRSLNVVTRLSCPNCKSTNVELTNIISHKVCGYAGLSMDFKKNDKLVCPNCGLELASEDDYNILGRIFYCHNCGRKTIKPELLFECLDCENKFDLETVLHLPLYQYVIDLEKIDRYLEKRLHVLITELLTKAGFIILPENAFKGRSGITHRFDIAALKDDAKLGIVLLKGDISSTELESFVASSYGASIDLGNVVIVILISYRPEIVIPEAFIHENLKIVTFERLEDLRTKLRSIIGEVLKGKTPVEKTGME